MRLCAGAWPHGPCRLLAFRKGGGLHPRHAGFLPAARPERAQQSPRRGRVLSSRSSAALAAGAWPHGPCRLLAFRKGGGLHPRHAGFLPAARPERAQQSPRRGRVLSSRSSAALSRRSVARRDSGGTPPRTCVSVLHKRERQLAAPRRESLRPSTDYSTLMMK